MPSNNYIEDYLPGIKLAGGIRSKLPVYLKPTQATTAGGGTILLSMGVAGIGLYIGSGAPTVTAAKASLYLRTDGSSTSTRLYVNTDGATTWTNVTTAA